METVNDAPDICPSLTLCRVPLRFVRKWGQPGSFCLLLACQTRWLHLFITLSVFSQQPSLVFTLLWSCRWALGQQLATGEQNLWWSLPCVIKDSLPCPWLSFSYIKVIFLAPVLWLGAEAQSELLDEGHCRGWSNISTRITPQEDINVMQFKPAVPNHWATDQEWSKGRPGVVQRSSGTIPKIFMIMFMYVCLQGVYIEMWISCLCLFLILASVLSQHLYRFPIYIFFQMTFWTLTTLKLSAILVIQVPEPSAPSENYSCNFCFSQLLYLF